MQWMMGRARLARMPSGTRTASRERYSLALRKFDVVLRHRMSLNKAIV